jgi:hypothetical protein
VVWASLIGGMSAAPQVPAKGSSRTDIRALLLIALDEKPPDNLPDKVMARVALLTTAVEFGRLLTAAPLEVLGQLLAPKETDDDDAGSSG